MTSATLVPSPTGGPDLPASTPVGDEHRAPRWVGALVAGGQLDETPAYAYDLAEVRANAHALRSELPVGARLCYSLKANPHPDVLACLRAAGVDAEVCSPGELDAALEAGFAAADLLYGGPGKRDRDVVAAIARGVRQFSVDSPEGLDQLERLAARAGVVVSCLLRVNDDVPSPGQGLTMTGTTSQFGADAGWVEAEPARFRGGPHAPTTGLHFYMGTNIAAVDDLLAQFDQVLGTVARLSSALTRTGCRLDTLDLGGGFAAPFATAGDRVDLSGLGAGLEALLHRHLGEGPWPELVFESGRHLVATAGALVTRVLDVKVSQGRRVAVLDAGINQLGGMSGLRRLPPLNPAVLDLGPRAGEVAPTVLAGPLCTPLDTWSRSARLPPLAVGDLLVVPNVGAYGLRASLMGFLAHPPALEVVVDGDAPGDGPVSTSRLTLVRRPC